MLKKMQFVGGCFLFSLFSLLSLNSGAQSQFDLEVKFALGLRIDERPFDHSSLGDFRERLLKSGKEKDIFDRIVAELIDKKLISKKEIQRIDATHIIADIALPNMVGMVKKRTFEILKKLKTNRPSLYRKYSTRFLREFFLLESIKYGTLYSEMQFHLGSCRFFIKR